MVSYVPTQFYSDNAAYSFRLALFGLGNVGKTAILHRFFTGAFLDKYRETVEDLHSKVYEVDGLRFQVEILDTAGNLSFPAMRRIEIKQAQAIVLVYSIDSKTSFQEVCNIFGQIKSSRTDYKTIPTVIVGNKSDLESDQINGQLVSTWIMELAATNCQICHLLTSAKTGENIEKIFKQLLHLSRVMEKRKAELQRLQALAAEQPPPQPRRRFSIPKLNKSFLGRSKSVATQETATRKISAPITSVTPESTRKMSTRFSRKSSSRKHSKVEEEIEYCTVQ